MGYAGAGDKQREVLDDLLASGREDLREPLLQLARAPGLDAAVGLLRRYFAGHRQGDIAGLRRVVSAFADKRLVRALVAGILEDEQALERIARSSYPHPIGFDKLVLHHEPGGFKLRLHVYWRTPQELAAERIHLHRFEMASSPITGELTNHLYAVRAADAPGIACAPREGAETLRFHAYSGYLRDAEGVLHQRFLGTAALERKGSLTFVPGQTYAQGLEAPHYVETNAETGHTNRDVCSTIYVHGPKLVDPAGRRIPVLFEEERIPDRVITPIPCLSVEQLEGSLRRYLALLDESLRFYAWLYDPKYGRNLSVGMVAGYLLSEVFGSIRTVEEWESHRRACEELLAHRSRTLARLVRGELDLAQLSEPREVRYFQQLLNKSYAFPDGREAWLRHYGDLARELERYLGALVGDYARNPDIKVLKPIWDMPTTNLRGGAHYGRIAALLEALVPARRLALAKFRTPVASRDDGKGPVSEVDEEVQKAVRTVLDQHFPGTPFVGEEGPTDRTSAAACRWLVDPIDGTRNFLAGHKNFAVSLAHQAWAEGWRTTDAVVALPAHGETYWAERGHGAYLIGADGRETRLRLPESPRGAGDGPGLRGALIDVSMRGLGRFRLPLLAALLEAGAVWRSSGSAAMMCAMVSGCGNQAALVTAEPYDVAAGLLVAEEAGARVATRDVERAAGRFRLYVVAESGLHEALLQVVDGVLAASDTDGGAPSQGSTRT